MHMNQLRHLLDLPQADIDPEVFADALVVEHVGSMISSGGGSIGRPYLESALQSQQLEVFLARAVETAQKTQCLELEWRKQQQAFAYVTSPGRKDNCSSGKTLPMQMAILRRWQSFLRKISPWICMPSYLHLFFLRQLRIPKLGDQRIYGGMAAALLQVSGANRRSLSFSFVGTTRSVSNGAHFLLIITIEAVRKGLWSQLSWMGCSSLTSFFLTQSIRVLSKLALAHRADASWSPSN
jgi:hypothetical protein